jgi:hypothetical protein
VSTKVGIDRALELSDGVADAVGSLTVEFADVIGVDVVRDGTDVVAILPIVGDDADVGYGGILECVRLALTVDNVTNLTSEVSMGLGKPKGSLKSFVMFYSWVFAGETPRCTPELPKRG